MEKIYRRSLFPALRRTFPRKRNFSVQQDGDKSLNACTVRSALHSLGVHFWERERGEDPPGDSGDLWPMETVWAWSQRRLIKKIQSSRKWRKGVKKKSATVKQLREWAEFCMRVVKSTKHSSIRALIDGMPKRFDHCIALKGGPIPK